MRIVEGVSRTGGGSSPTGERPTRLLSISVAGGDAGGLASRLRKARPPVIGRVRDGKLLLDLRTVLEEQDTTLGDCLAGSIASGRDGIRR
jgi:L-seryl-tRNA(Ser) seleniumtransferase